MSKEHPIGFGDRPPGDAHGSAEEDPALKQRIGFIQKELEERAQHTSFEVAGFGRELKSHWEIPEGRGDPLLEFVKTQEPDPVVQKKVETLLHSLQERETGMYEALARKFQSAADAIKQDDTMSGEERLEQVTAVQTGAEFHMDEMGKIADAFRWRIFTVIASSPSSARAQEAGERKKMVDALEQKLQEELVMAERMAARWAAKIRAKN